MRILHFDYDDLKNPYAGGGQAKATFNVNSRLVNMGNKVVVYTGKYPKSQNETFKGIEYKRIGIGNLGAIISILTYWILIPFIIVKNQNEFDLIMEFFTVPFSASFAPLVAKIPIVACPSFFNARELSAKYKIPFYLFEEWGIRKYKYFIALTNASKYKLTLINANAKINVIPRGVSQINLEMTNTLPKYFLFLGRIDIYQKGLDILLKAFSNVLNNNSDIILKIAGGGSNSEILALKKIAIELNITKNIEIIGRVEGENKNKLIADSLGVICPSRFENFGNVGLEALSMGKPLICSDIDGFDFIPNNIALKVKAFSINDLTTSMIDILENINIRNKLSINSKEFAKQFDWNILVNNYENYYQSIIQQ